MSIERESSAISNRPVLFASLALGLVVIGLVGADMFVPKVIADAYAGAGPARLVRFFESRRDRHSLEHYLNLWRDFRTACLLGAGAFAIVLGLIQRLLQDLRQRTAVIVFSAAFLALTVLWGPRQDYVAHLKIWEEVSAGRDPWWIQADSGIVLNAYGPLFEILAPAADFNPLLPKILFATAYLVYATWILKISQSDAKRSRKGTWLRFLWLASPFFWLEIAFYGHFDVLVGLAVVAALGAIGRGSPGMAGVMIGLGFLLKFIPVVLVPFLAVETGDDGKWRIRWHFLVSAVVVMAGGMAVAWGIWGDSVVRPLAFVSTRGSSLLSVWRYAKGPHSPLAAASGAAIDLDRFATPALAAALGIVWLLMRKRRTKASHAALIALVTTFTFYRVGFVQYLMIPFLVLPVWYFENRDSVAARPSLRISLILYVVWISAFDLFDNAVGGIVGFERPWAWLEDWVGLPNFLIGMWVLANLLRIPAYEGSNRSTRTGPVED